MKKKQDKQKECCSYLIVTSHKDALFSKRFFQYFFLIHQPLFSSSSLPFLFVHPECYFSKTAVPYDQRFQMFSRLDPNEHGNTLLYTHQKASKDYPYISWHIPIHHYFQVVPVLIILKVHRKNESMRTICNE